MKFISQAMAIWGMSLILYLPKAGYITQGMVIWSLSPRMWSSEVYYPGFGHLKFITQDMVIYSLLSRGWDYTKPTRYPTGDEHPGNNYLELVTQSGSSLTFSGSVPSDHRQNGDKINHIFL